MSLFKTDYQVLSSPDAVSFCKMLKHLASQGYKPVGGVALNNGLWSNGNGDQQLIIGDYVQLLSKRVFVPWEQFIQGLKGTKK